MKPSYRIAELEKSLEVFRQRAFAAEQERDALKSTEERVVRLANSNSDLWEEMANRLEAAERERDSLRERLSLVREQRDAELNKNTQLEAEIARRDAAAREPADRIVDDGGGQQIGGVGVSDRLNCVWPIGTKFYTAAQPAVLPPTVTDKTICDISGLEWVKNLDAEECQCCAEVYNQAIADAIALGAQPQKVDELPTSFTVIGENIRSQDNRCTADPIFCVFEKVPTPAAAPAPGGEK